MNSLPILRSLLFVPGSRPEFLPKAEAAKPDAIILDLEDSVPVHAKDQARMAVATALRERVDRLTAVRINHPALEMIDADVAALAPHTSQIVLLSKVNSIEDVKEIDRRLATFEQTHALPTDAISIMLGIESAAGLRVLYDALQGTPRARGAVLATAEEGDLIVDIGGRWSPEGQALAYSRGKFVCDARAAGAVWLMDGAFMNLESTQALETESRLARLYGFNGKVAIHPRQVSAINIAFSPTSEELDRAQRLIVAFRAAETQGRGAVNFEGMMVDYANVKQAEKILAFSRR
jgi:citrate lyase subunit beta / citryl-CoA lyase